MRLDKFLVDCGVGSRTEVKQLLKQKENRSEWEKRDSREATD